MASLFFRQYSRVIASGLPPSKMSVPRPAMLVETVTAPLRPGLGDHFGFALVLLGVEHLVGDAGLLKQAPRFFRISRSRCCPPARAGRSRILPDAAAAGAVFLQDAVYRRLEFLGLGAIDNVGKFFADEGLVGGNGNNFQFVDLVELGGFGFRGAGHPGELGVHAEIILEGDGGEGLVLALDLDALFGFDGLMQAV